MTSRDFCFWLQGLFELQNPQQLTERQTTKLKQHLSLVFKHEIDQSMGPEAHQDELNAIHSPIGNLSGPPNEDIHVMRC